MTGILLLFFALLAILSAAVCFLIIRRRKCKERKRIMALTDSLKETYYIAELLPKPEHPLEEAYYYALKKACKAMNDRISDLESQQRDYREYVESFAHEIKVPIGALSLTFDNAKDYELKKETDKIFQLVEQMLYYARSGDTQKDYFVKKLYLEDVLHEVVLKFRRPLLEAKAAVDLHDLDAAVYTDEKWLHFILGQIVQNSIKYFDKSANRLTVYCRQEPNSVRLFIEDNGCGIPASDLGRVFEKGFTGSNRTKANATGMGLYLARKLCQRLGLSIEITSHPGAYTSVCITFPKSSIHTMEEF